MSSSFTSHAPIGAFVLPQLPFFILPNYLKYSFSNLLLYIFVLRRTFFAKKRPILFPCCCFFFVCACCIIGCVLYVQPNNPWGKVFVCWECNYTYYGYISHLLHPRFSLFFLLRGVMHNFS